VELSTDTQKSQAHAVEKLLAGRAKVETELAKIIVGQKEVIEQILIALFAGGHCLITGAPGLAKTLLVKSIARIFHLDFQRIQFTPDLMPADITGSEILQETGEGRKMLFVRGPVFANIILADEIYEKLTYDDVKHVSIASLSPEAYDLTITVNGFTYSDASGNCHYWMNVNQQSGPNVVVNVSNRHISGAGITGNGITTAGSVTLNVS